MVLQQENNVFHLTEGLLIEAYPQTRPELGWGGGGSGSGGWGLNEGRRRGTGGPGRINEPPVPGLRQVLAEEHLVLSNGVDAEFAPVYSNLAQTIQTRLSTLRADTQNITHPTERLTAEQTALLDYIEEVRSASVEQSSKSLGFFGNSPFYKPPSYFYQRVLQASSQGTPEKAFFEFIDAYTATHQLKVLDITLETASSRLSPLATALEQSQDLSTLQYQDKAKILAERTALLRAEQLIHFQQLPDYLQAEIIAISAVTSDMNAEQALASYVATLEQLAFSKTAAIGTFTVANPKINAPLTRTELEALHSLVAGQQSGVIGQRWADYHQVVLLQESARHLNTAHSAFNGLLERAQRINHLLIQVNAEEQARLAQHQAELAEAQRAEEQAKQEAEAARLAEEKERQRTIYSALGSAANSLPLVIPVGGAAFDLSRGSYLTLQLAMRTALLGTAASAGAVVNPVIVGMVSLLWPSTLTNGERQYLTSVPLADLSPPEGTDLAALATAGGSLDLPYTLSTAEHEDQLHLLVGPGHNPIPVRAATLDSARQVYSLALDNPSRTLTWTPAEAPGSDLNSSTSLPPAPPGAIVYTGSTLKPVSNEQENYPALDLPDLERLIVIFPADSGLAPILVMFKDRRMEPGVVTGGGEDIDGVWLGEVSRGTGAAIPVTIAEKLAGKEVKNFRALRESFWKAVGNDEELLKQFSSGNIERMKYGYAPIARRPDWHKSQKTFILHHVQPISERGAVYDLSNIKIVTPAAHQVIHHGKNHDK